MKNLLLLIRLVRGWTAKDIRAKLENFITKIVDQILQSINAEKKEPVHGDFSMFSCYIPALLPSRVDLID